VKSDSQKVEGANTRIKKRRGAMSLKKETTLRDYVAKRKKEDPAFADGYEEGYQKFRLGVMLKMARKEAKLTQADVAERMGTTKSVISRLEKQADDMMASTLFKYLNAVGRELAIK
jgi:DNA-binding XRE family transcriptional regulator